MPSIDATPDSRLLDAAFAPPAPGLESLIVLFGPVELTPGAWRRAEDSLSIPESARRLSLPVGDPEAPRFAVSRALTVAEAIPFLVSLGPLDVRPSVRAWQLAAHVAQRIEDGVMAPRGTEATDAAIDKLVAAMPPTGCSVLIDSTDDEDDIASVSRRTATGEVYGYKRLGARELLNAFFDSAQHAFALGVALRSIPARGTSRVLARLTLRLAMPSRRDAPWLLHLMVDPDATRDQIERTLDAASAQFKPLNRWQITSPAEPIELSVDEASALIIAAVELQARGASVELPSELTAGIERHVDARLHLGDNVDSTDTNQYGMRGKSSGTKTRSSGVRGGGLRARFRMGDLVSYDLSVALGGQDVTADEIRELARQARSLIEVNGEWVALTETTREQLEKLAQAVESHESVMANSQALAAALSGSTQIAGGITATIDRVDNAMLGRAISYLRNPEEFPAVESPEGFVGTLRPYQQDGVNWLSGMSSLPIGACLADDMGLGKTVQVIALFCHRIKEDDNSLRALVVCPTSLIGNWERELQRFAPHLKLHVHHGPARASRLVQLPADANVTITSYGLVARDRAMLSQIGWDILVCDEAQAVKNQDTEQARAVRVLDAPFKVALTGTPMENRLLELWSMFDLLNPGLLGTATVFNRKFANPIERASDENAAATLRAVTRPFMLRRVKTDPKIVPDLPEKQEHSVLCTLTPEQAALYQATVDAAMGDVRTRDGIARRGAVLALLTKLKQICNHPAQALKEVDPTIAGRSGKLDRLEMMLGEVVAEGDRALVFTQYAQMGHLLVDYLPDYLGCDVLFLHGGVPRAKREEMVAKFQSETDKPAVFVLSLKAGGLGLNLMQASHVFHYDRWWNPAVEDQATDRTHRIGQTRQIQVHKLVCAGTLEERIASVIDEKRALAGKIIDVAGSGEGWITELDDAQLEALVSLSGASVAFE